MTLYATLSIRTRFIRMWYVWVMLEAWLMCMQHGSSVCDMTHSYAICLTYTWCDLFIHMSPKHQRSYHRLISMPLECHSICVYRVSQLALPASDTEGFVAQHQEHTVWKTRTSGTRHYTFQRMPFYLFLPSISHYRAHQAARCVNYTNVSLQLLFFFSRKSASRSATKLHFLS